MFDLSKDADALICILYKTYVVNVNEGNERPDVIKSLDDIKQESFPYWDKNRFLMSRGELEKLNLLVLNDGSAVQLTDSAVDYMKQRFNLDLDEVEGYIKRIRSVFWSK